MEDSDSVDTDDDSPGYYYGDEDDDYLNQQYQMYFDELGLEQYVDYVYYYDFEYDDDDDEKQEESHGHNKNKNRKRHKFNPALFRGNGTRRRPPGGAGGGGGGNKRRKHRPHHHQHGHKDGEGQGHGHGHGAHSSGTTAGTTPLTPFTPSSSSPPASSSTPTASTPVGVASSVSHSHYSEDFDLEALKKRMKNLGNNTFVRTRRQALTRKEQELELQEHPLVDGILDMRRPTLFRTGAFTPITLGAFTILSTGTAGREQKLSIVAEQGLFAKLFILP